MKPMTVRYDESYLTKLSTLEQAIQSQPHASYMSKDADLVQWYGDGQITQARAVAHKLNPMNEALRLVARNIVQLHIVD